MVVENYTDKEQISIYLLFFSDILLCSNLVDFISDLY